MGAWFGASWETVGYVVATTVAMYCTTVVAVRVAGRRTVAQLSAFDVVVTIALGSVIASTVVSREPSYAQGITAVSTLLALQVVAGALRQRFPLARRLLDFAPVVAARDGRFELRSTPLGPQLTEGELLSTLREQGVFDMDDVRLVIIEPNGGVSVVRRGDAVGDAVRRIADA